MAKIHEEIIVIKLYKLIKETEVIGVGDIATPDVVQALTSVTEELVGDAVIVEVELNQ
jgi:PHP family Zn ribbon phosphoesterase